MTARPPEGEISFVRRVLRHRTSLLLKELSALKRHAGGEAVHDTRVQSRRLRAALDAFRVLFDPAPWNSAYASIRQITKTLGRPRETAVTLSLVDELGAVDDLADNLCREYLAERLRRKLAKQERALGKRLGEVDTKDVSAKMKVLFSRLRPGSIRPAGTRTRARPASAYEPPARARQVLEEFAAPIMAFKPSRPVGKTKDARLHELRISAKKLRYAMEIFDETWPDGLRGRISLAKALQDAGGVFQDWCILCERLKKEAKRLRRRRSRHLAAQVGSLLARARKRKAELKEMILPALAQLQMSLRTLPAGRVEAGSGKEAPSGRRRKTGK